MYFIDTHAHLFLDEFDDDRDIIINECINDGVNKIVNPNVDIHTVNGLLSLKNKYPDIIFPAIGLHPTSVKGDFKNQLTKLYDLIDKYNFVAIGEIGIDLYWDKTHFEEQKIAFETQIQWAREFELPLIIHTRNSFDVTFSIVSKYSDISGVFHAFTGNYEQAMKVIERNFYIGIGGIVTFKNSGLDKVIEKVPIENIVLETDSPYLAPVPFRGKRNQPSYIRYVADHISKIKNISVEKVVETTNSNALSLFF